MRADKPLRNNYLPARRGQSATLKREYIHKEEFLYANILLYIYCKPIF